MKKYGKNINVLTTIKLHTNDQNQSEGEKV